MGVADSRGLGMKGRRGVVLRDVKSETRARALLERVSALVLVLVLMATVDAVAVAMAMAMR